MEKYERLRELGRGSYGCAVLVRDRNSRQQRVVKEIDLSRMPALAKNEAQNEVNVLRGLKHPHIVAYCDSFLAGRMLCIVMEFADAGDLSQLIKRKRSISEQLRESEVLPIFAQCCLALHYVHRRHVLHRDLKSQNIFMTLAGAVKLGDFGIAKVLDHTAAEAITMIGTPIYLAPEVCHSKPYGMKADVWSMGVVLYELLALAPPFTGANMAALINNIVTATPRELNAELYGPKLRELVMDILQKAPEMRPSVAEILGRSPLRDVAEALPAWSLYAPEGAAAVEVVGDDMTMPGGGQNVPDTHLAQLESLEDVQKRSGDLRRRPPLPMPDSARVANEYRQNREAALAAKARVLGRTGQRSLSAEPAVSAASSANSACERAAREAEHLLALQQAAMQARRDRQQVQQRLQAEMEANAARYQLETLNDTFERPSSAENEKQHLADLQEAAAQARRDRRLVQQKIRDLEKNSESERISNLTEMDPQDLRHDQGLDRPSPRGEEEHLLALQEARAQARRDRKVLDAKRKALADEGREDAPRAERAPRPELDTEDSQGARRMAKAEVQRLEEEKRYRELRKASAQARRERKLLQQKVREIEWGDGRVDVDPFERDESNLRLSTERSEGSHRLSSTLNLAGQLSLSRPASVERSVEPTSPAVEHVHLGASPCAPSIGEAHSASPERRAAARNETLGSLSYSLTAPFSTLFSTSS
ncbi:unnamed protein product [Durusdinium trenchii]|uniref:non-specific serine/threonine protein kinase n=1 Tax=Durusdinium trenchii TaxID=1381693 RepID=A0ABP0PPC7_9DINO